MSQSRCEVDVFCFTVSLPAVQCGKPQVEVVEILSTSAPGTYESNPIRAVTVRFL